MPRAMESPSPVRLAMAEWMLTHGSDVHQGGDGPLMRVHGLGIRAAVWRRESEENGDSAAGATGG
jgi:hypothetical protein